MSARWVNACGKLPICSPVRAISSEYRPDVIGVRQHLLEGQLGLVELAGPSQGVHPAEGAQREGPLGPAQTVRRGARVVAVDQAVGDELLAHGVQRGQPHRIVRRDQAEARRAQQRRVQHVGVVVLHERAALGVPALVEDLLVDGVPGARPPLEGRGAAVLGGQPDAAVEGDPRHGAAVGEVLPAAAGLPDALLGLVPVLGEPVEDADDALPAGVPDLDPGVVAGVDAVECLAVDVELELVRGAVADPHGPRVAVARPVVERFLDEVGGAVDPVHDVERRPVAVAGALGDPVAQPAGEPGRLLDEAQPEQRPHRERGVPDPGVAVVPVPLAAHLLRQRSGRCGDEAAGRRVGHELERDRRALDHLAPAAPVGRSLEPGAPERRRLRVVLRDLQRADLPRRPRAPLEHHAAGLAGRQRQRAAWRSPSSLRTWASRSSSRSRTACRVSPSSPGREDRPRLGEPHLVRSSAVVEAGGDGDVERQRAPDARHHPDQPVPGGPVPRRRRHEVDHLADPVLGEEAGDEDRRVRQVQLLASCTPSRSA